MNACPAPYVTAWHWLPSDLKTVSEPDLTTTIAPPGCECQPEEPPGRTVICAIATLTETTGNIWMPQSSASALSEATHTRRVEGSRDR
jgi:hypothetical protein